MSDKLSGTLIYITFQQIFSNYMTFCFNVLLNFVNLSLKKCRIENPIKLTITEVIFLNGIYLYCKHVSTCISRGACLKFMGYNNLGKIKYYLGSLLEKGMIRVAEIIHSYNHYKLTPLGISVINDINGSFERCLYDWFNKYSISL